MTARGELPPPNVSGLAAVLASRHREPAPAKPTQVAMSRRSWHMTQTSADALAGALADLHHELRMPKHQVLAALVEVALGHLDEVRTRLAPMGAASRANIDPPRAG